MSQIVKLRRSSVSGQKPTNSNLQLGELALNTTDGKVYMAVSGSLGPSVEELISTNTVNTGSINLSGSINLTGSLKATETLSGSVLHIVSGYQPQLQLKNTTTGNEYHIGTGAQGLLSIHTGDNISIAHFSTSSIDFHHDLEVTGSVTATEFTGSGLGLTNVPFHISGSDVEGNQSDKTFTKLHFDSDTGLNVSESAPGTAFISIGSHFKDIFVSGSPILSATGSDAFEIIPTGGVEITTSITDTNGNGYVKELNISTTTLSSSLNNRINTITGSLNSFTSSINTFTSSVVLTSQTGSMTVLSASYALTAAFALNAGGGGSSSGAALGSYNSLVVTSAASTWSFEHNTGQQYPIFQVFDSNGYVVIPSQIRAIDNDNAEIIFPSPQTGRVIASLGGGNGTTETFTNSATWTVDHNLGTDYPNVTVWDSNRNIVFPNRIESVSSNQIKLYFSQAISGNVSVSRGGHILSGSVNWETLSGKPSGLVSGSSQLTGSYDTRYVLSGSITQTTWDNIANKPSGLISGSVQVELTGTTGYSTFSSSINSSVGNVVNNFNTFTSSYTTGSFTGSFKGDGSQLYNIPSSGVTGLELYKIVSGSVSASISPNRGLEINTKTTITGSITLALTEDPDPTGLTTQATHLFVSASNNQTGEDLYIRQKDNKVKWKWFEGKLNSGILWGGSLSYSGSTIYITRGSGIVINQRASATNEISPMTTYVNWNDITASCLNVTSSLATYVGIDTSGSLYQQNNYFSVNQYRETIPLGMFNHTNKSTITSYANDVLTAYDDVNQTANFIQAFGPLKLGGLTLHAQSGNLQLTIDSGQSYIYGGFYQQDPNNSSHKITPQIVTPQIARVRRDGNGSFIVDNNGGSFYNSIDSDYWDDGTGTLNTMSTGDWQIQRVFFNPFTTRVHVYYGQSVYSTFINAKQYLATDPFVEAEYSAHQYVFLGYLIIKGQTNNLSDDNNNVIVQSGLFRNTVGSSGGAQTLATLHDLSDVEIATEANGDLLIYNSTTGKWTHGKSLNGNYEISGSLRVIGDITAQQYIVSSSITHLTQSFSSGSTIFGNSSDDTHVFTGSILVNGNVSATSLTGSINFNNLTNVPSGIVSGSEQLTGSYDTRYVLSGSITQTTWDNIASKPDGIISGSSQIVGLGFLETGSFNTLSSSFNTMSSSINTRVETLGTNDYNQDAKLSSLINKTGSYATTGSNSLVGNQRINGNLSVTGSLVISGSLDLSSANIDNSRYLYTQTTGSTTWTVNHNLNYDYPNVTVYDADNKIMIPADVTSIDTNTTVITFATAETGHALVSIGGISTGAADRFLYTSSPAFSTWTINHNLGYKYVNVDVYDLNDEQLIPQKVTAISENTLQIDFATPTGGNAIITIGGARSTSLFVQTGSFYTATTNIGITGSLVVTGDVDANTFNTTSDKKLKTNLVRIESALDKIEKLNGYTFDWLEEYSEDRTRQIGMVADEVYEVQPELISNRTIMLGGKEEQIKLLDYSKVTALLLEAIKELNDKVKKLENK